MWNFDLLLGKGQTLFCSKESAVLRLGCQERTVKSAEVYVIEDHLRDLEILRTVESAVFEGTGKFF